MQKRGGVDARHVVDGGTLSRPLQGGRIALLMSVRSGQPGVVAAPRQITTIPTHPEKHPSGSDLFYGSSSYYTVQSIEDKITGSTELQFRKAIPCHPVVRANRWQAAGMPRHR